jgi:hypothetical protein
MMMKSETVSPKLAIAQALAKGTCPLCSVLKHFVDELVENLGPDQATSACKTHTWALAKAAPAEAAVASFLKTIEAGASDEPSRCGICVQRDHEESERLDELAAEMKHRRMLDWFERYGTLCRNHAEKLRKHVPAELRAIVDQIVYRNVVELQEQLSSYREQVREGHRTGGGLLGRAAEFLVGQRGL